MPVDAGHPSQAMDSISPNITGIEVYKAKEVVER
jgi:hypothetical protein